MVQRAATAFLTIMTDQCTAKLGSGWCREDGMNGRNCQSPYIFCDWLRAESRICTDRLKTVSRFPTLRVEALELLISASAPQRFSASALGFFRDDTCKILTLVPYLSRAPRYSNVNKFRLNYKIRQDHYNCAHGSGVGCIIQSFSRRLGPGGPLSSSPIGLLTYAYLFVIRPFRMHRQSITAIVET